MVPKNEYQEKQTLELEQVTALKTLCDYPKWGHDSHYTLIWATDNYVMISVFVTLERREKWSIQFYSGLVTF